MESICTLFFTLILILPLVIQLQMLIADPKKLCTIFHYYATTEDSADKTTPIEILRHYPKESTAVNLASSNSELSLTNLRNVSSSPVISNNQPPPIPNEAADQSRSNTALAIAKHSSTFVAKTNQELPVVDITCDYSSYRHKTFEDCLRDRYGGKYPPGGVVLNSMHLNLLDSHTSVAGLFDFLREDVVEQRVEASVVPRRLEIEYLNPLDHFVAKQLDRPSTASRFTETEAASIESVINGREKKQADRRSSRKIEAASKCYLSSSSRVYGTDEPRSRRCQAFREHDRLRTLA
ncbi:uncharacterized protein LOC143428064 [Xylocopa sonorina]|uniref:uncharacterized protein LOC143428064 n=1 Tax=Xylocopa sonorina TaxID=1818115 RepID=UPI00403AB75E